MIFKSIFERRKYSLHSLQLACTSTSIFLSPLWLISFWAMNTLWILVWRGARDGISNWADVTLGRTYAPGLMSYVLHLGLVPGTQSSHRKRKAGHEPQDLKIDMYHVLLCKIYLISRTASQVTISAMLRLGAISVEGFSGLVPVYNKSHLYTPVMALSSYDAGFLSC